MPNFKTHFRINSLVAGASLVPALFMAVNRGQADPLFLTVGIGLSTILNGDLDLKSQALNSWGILKYFWYPYMKKVKHRDILHWPVIGTLARMMYLSILLLILQSIFDFDIKISWIWWTFWGLAMGDTVHWILDVMSTRAKRAF